MTATKAELVQLVSEKIREEYPDASKKMAELAVNATLNSIAELTVSRGVLNIIGYGKYEIRERSGRKGRNPQTGEETYIEPSKQIAFKAGKKLKEFVKANA